jgi:hypothetical protein
MGEIYSKSQRVLIWLGQEDTDSQQRSRLCKSFSASHQQQETRSGSFVGFHRASKYEFAHTNQYVAVRALLELPWLRRAWVVQEAVLPATATCFLGSLNFSVDVLWDLVTSTRNGQEKAATANSTKVGIR